MIIDIVEIHSASIDERTMIIHNSCIFDSQSEREPLVIPSILKSRYFVSSPSID